MMEVALFFKHNCQSLYPNFGKKQIYNNFYHGGAMTFSAFNFSFVNEFAA